MGTQIKDAVKQIRRVQWAAIKDTTKLGVSESKSDAATAEQTPKHSQ